MVTTDLWHIEKNSDLIQAIGKVTVRWATLDMLLLEILSVAIENHALAVDVILTRPGAGRQRIEAFDRAIGGSRLTQLERGGLLELTGRFLKLLGERNDIVHTPLVTSIKVQGKKFAYVTEKLGRKGKRQKLSISSIDQHLKDVGEALAELERAYGALVMRYVNLEKAEI